MQIVTDMSADMSQEQLEGLNIHHVPMLIMFGGKTYRSGVDIQNDGFYKLLETSDEMPTTSQPSAGECAEVFRRVAAIDPDIIAIHISSTLSGTFNSVRLGAEMVTEANISLVDSRTVSGPEGWQVEAAVHARDAGWTREQILSLVQRVSDVTDVIFTVSSLKHLIHGGRVGHLAGLAASTLRIKPIMGIDKASGTFQQYARVRTFKRTLRGIGDIIARQHREGAALRIQVGDGHNREGAEMLREHLDNRFDCTWLPITSIAPVLGAHTGPSVVGVVIDAHRLTVQPGRVGSPLLVDNQTTYKAH